MDVRMAAVGSSVMRFKAHIGVHALADFRT
jgi:hypothetical protein